MNSLRRDLKPGERVVVKAEMLQLEYAPLKKRIVTVWGGFGMSHLTAGGKVSVKFECDGPAADTEILYGDMFSPDETDLLAIPGAVERIIALEDQLEAARQWAARWKTEAKLLHGLMSPDDTPMLVLAEWDAPQAIPLDNLPAWAISGWHETPFTPPPEMP